MSRGRRNTNINQPVVEKPRDMFSDFPIPEHGLRRLVKNRPLRIAMIVESLMDNASGKSILQLCRELIARNIDLFVLNIPHSNETKHLKLQKEVGSIAKYRYDMPVDRIEYIKKYIISVNPDMVLYNMDDVINATKTMLNYPPTIQYIGGVNSLLKTVSDNILKSTDITLSVVMPCYNCEKTLIQSIDSILWQTYEGFELICVDDGSTDKTYQILVKYQTRDDRIQVLKQEHCGIVRALNWGISNASTDLIARMDSDDIAFPARFEKQIAFINEHPEIDVVGSQARCFKNQNEVIRDTTLPILHNDIAEYMKSNNPMAHPTTMYRKEIWERVGYKGDGRAEDYRFWCEIILAGGKLANMNEVLLFFRVKDNPTYDAWVNSSISDIQKFYKEGLGIYET